MLYFIAGTIVGGLISLLTLNYTVKIIERETARFLKTIEEE